MTTIRLLSIPKRAQTLAERQLDFEDAKLVFETTNFETEDTRKDYGEKRILCFGMLKNRMVVIGYTRVARIAMCSA